MRLVSPMAVIAAVLTLASTATVAAPTASASAARTSVLAPGNFIHVVSHLDRTIVFYRDILGLEQVRFGGGAAPHFAANPAVARLYHVPESTPIGVVMFRLPHTRVGPILAKAHAAHVPVVTRSGAARSIATIPGSQRSSPA